MGATVCWVGIMGAGAMVCVPIFNRAGRCRPSSEILFLGFSGDCGVVTVGGVGVDVSRMGSVILRNRGRSNKYIPPMTIITAIIMDR